LEEKMPQRVKKLRPLEGHPVAVVLVDGSHIDDCQLVSVTGGGEGGVWLIDDDVDVLIPLLEVAELMALPAVRGWAA
jgi:hypothetical protein